jgi:NAD(P)-dependent dehydrogenase (short-subunit alcohol dehydrogenase family)
MENKNILGTGATGGIGGAITEVLLEHGYKVYVPVRSIEKLEAIFGKNPNLVPALCDVENTAATESYIKSLYDAHVMFKALILGAGGLRYDHEFIEGDAPDEEKKELFKQLSAEERIPLEAASADANFRLNVLTKENVIGPFLKFYNKAALETELRPIGSQAAGFEVGHPWRFDEEGYHLSQFEARGMGPRYKDFFKKSEVAEPALIDTPLTRVKFALNDDGTPRDWSKVMKPRQYAEIFLTEAGFI